jgi:hypothetical protein
VQPSKDYTLVEGVQRDSKDSALTLYKRFNNLIVKYAYRTSSPEDFMQDAFEILILAAKKVRLGDISNPEKWGFYVYLGWYLSGVVKKQIKREQRLCEGYWQNSYDTIDESVFDERHPGALAEETLSTEAHHRHSMRSSKPAWAWTSIPASLIPSDLYNRYSPANESFRSRASELYRRYLASCTKEERQLIRCREKGDTIGLAAEKVGISYIRARKILLKSKARAYREIVEAL